MSICLGHNQTEAFDRRKQRLSCSRLIPFFPLLRGSRSSCRIFTTLRSNFSGVTIAPHEDPNSKCNLLQFDANPRGY
jgi:hypothetical protein